MQKLSIFIVLIFITVTGTVSAQIQIGYVDSDAIMKELPDAQDAQTRLDALIQEWNEELKKIEKDWKTKYDDYENQKLIMSQQRRAEVEKELVQLENNISDYRQKKFGVDGDLFKKQEELMTPVQNKVFNAINDVAKEMDLDFVFDRSGDILFLYAKEEYDITPLVLEKLK